MFGNLGFGEIMVILVVVLLLFGARRLPEIGASFGKGIREFKKSLSEVNESVTSMPSEPTSSQGRQLDAPAPSGQATTSSGEPKRLSQ